MRFIGAVPALAALAVTAALEPFPLGLKQSEWEKGLENSYSGALPYRQSRATLAGSALAEPVRSYAIEGDTIRRSLTGRPGEAARGESLVADRRMSLCLLCHQGPFPEPHGQGTLAPDLRGVGGRLSEGQIRLRIVDMPRLNPSTIMPSNYRINDHDRVAAAWRGKPILRAQDIEDIVAFLVMLRE